MKLGAFQGRLEKTEIVTNFFFELNCHAELILLLYVTIQIIVIIIILSVEISVGSSALCEQINLVS